jgi:hypothetical protein
MGIFDGSASTDGSSDAAKIVIADIKAKEPAETEEATISQPPPASSGVTTIAEALRVGYVRASDAPVRLDPVAPWTDLPNKPVLAPDIDPRVEPPRRKGSQLETVSDLLSNYPELADPESGFFFEVERTKPQACFGQNVSGTLGSFPAMDSSQFAEFFGGGTYIVRCKGPTRRGRDDPNTGLPLTTTYASVTQKFPGSPRYMPGGQLLPAFPMPQQQPSQQGQQMSGRMFSQPGFQPVNLNGMGAESAAVKQLADLSGRIIERQLDGSQQQHPADGNLLHQVLGVAEKSTEAQVSVLRDMLASRDRELQEMRAEMRSVAQNNPTDRLTEKMFDMRNSTAQVEQLGRDYAERLERLHAQQREELRIKESLFGERLKLVEEAAKAREEVLRNEIRREREMLTESYERKVAEARSDREREVSQLRSDAQRGVDQLLHDKTRAEDLLRKDHERDLAQRDGLHRIALEAKQAEIERLRTDLMSMKTEVEGLRREINKPVAVKLQESREMARMTGMVDREEVETPEPVQRESTLDKLIKGLGPALPKLAPQIMKAAGDVAQATQERVAPRPAPARALPPAPVASKPSPQASARPASPQPIRKPPSVMFDADGTKIDPTPPRARLAPAAAPPAPPPAPAATVATTPSRPSEAAGADQGEVSAPTLQLVERGPRPADNDVMAPLIGQFFAHATDSYNKSLAPEAFAAEVLEQAGPFAPPIAAWLDADNVVVLMQMQPEGSRWGMTGPSEWMKQAWAELEKLTNYGQNE